MNKNNFIYLHKYFIFYIKLKFFPYNFNNNFNIIAKNQKIYNITVLINYIFNIILINNKLNY